MNRAAAALGLAGAAAYLSLYLLFPLVSPIADAGFSIDRDEALGKTRAAAAHFGLATDAWEAAAAVERNPRNQYYLAQHPSGPAGAVLTAWMIKVSLVEPGARRRFTASLDPRGRLLGFKLSDPKVSEGSEQSSEEAVSMSRAALQFLMPDRAADFSVFGAPASGEEGTEVLWEAESLRDRHASPEFRFLIRGDQVVEAELESGFSPAFLDGYSRRNDAAEVLFAAAAILVFCGFVAGLAFYVIGSLDRVAPQRSAFALLALLALLWLLYQLGGGGWEEEVVGGEVWTDHLIGTVLFVLFVLTPAALGVWGGGYVLAVRSSPERHVTFDLALRGRLASRPVARGALAGLFGGGLLAAIPYGLAALNLFPSAQLETVDLSGMMSRFPAIPDSNLLTDGPLTSMAILFAVVYPMTEAYVRSSKAVWLMRGGCAIVLLSLWPFEDSLGAALACAFVLWLAAHQFYRRWGLLSIVMASIAAVWALRALSLLAQPASTLHSSGLWSALALGALTAVLAAFAARGSRLDVDQEVQRLRVENREAAGRRKAVREKLVAEFDVARKAQQLMLPGTPPRLPRYDLASLCRPAREVGGDLYDFLALPDGRLAVVVADVSGKGVPAALYMTLTKGLLTAVSEKSSAPREIVCRVNWHFHDCAHRNVFVTLALGVIDPDNGRIDCARAGHNPLIWRRRKLDQTIFLKPSGIGVGLTPGRLFDRSLAVETIQVEPGDGLFLYSDGVTEAMNRDNDEYGEDRLSAAIAGADDLDAAQTCRFLLQDVDDFLGDTPQNDDITIVALKAL